MSMLKALENEALSAIKDVASSYQAHEECFNDEKYAELNSYFIQPLVARANSLMNAFEDIENTVNWFSDEDIIDD